LGLWRNKRSIVDTPIRPEYDGYQRQMKKDVLLAVLAAISISALSVAGCTKVAEPSYYTSPSPAVLSSQEAFNASAGFFDSVAVSHDDQLPTAGDILWYAHIIRITATVMEAPKDTWVTSKWVQNIVNRKLNDIKSFDKDLFMDFTTVTGTQNIIFEHLAPSGGFLWEYCGYTVYLKLNGKDCAKVRFWVSDQPYRNSPGSIGIMLLSPNNEQKDIARQLPQFSWYPGSYVNVNKYQFELARDSAFKQIIISTAARSEVTNPQTYIYPGMLDYGTSYFWRVRASEINGQNIPGDWSATFSFQTEQAPKLTPTESTWILNAIGLHPQ
jgi:hypothetical protein